MKTYIGQPPVLRFVIRPVMTVDPWDGPYQTGEARILQYGLRPVSGGPVEWFDVPCVEPESGGPQGFSGGGWTSGVVQGEKA